jgi:hypothetical protein
MVRQQIRNDHLGGLKDDESRTGPIGDSLAPVLRTWNLKTGGAGLSLPARAEGESQGRVLDAETERYAHLGPSHFGPRDLSAVSVDLPPLAGAVFDHAAHRRESGTAGHGVATDADPASTAIPSDHSQPGMTSR